MLDVRTNLEEMHKKINYPSKKYKKYQIQLSRIEMEYIKMYIFIFETKT